VPPPPRCAELPERFVEWHKQEKRRRHLNKLGDVESLDFHGMGGNVEGLRAILNHKYGSIVRGWRIAFAPDEAGAFPVKEYQFYNGLKAIGYGGYGRSLWLAISKRVREGMKAVGRLDAYAELDDLEPDLAQQLDLFVTTLRELFEEGAVEAWPDVPREHIARATFDEFEEFVMGVDILPDDIDLDLPRIFDALDTVGSGTITFEDFRFLDHWASTRLGYELPVEPEVEKEERVEWSPPPAEKEKPPGLDEFRAFLEQRYGSAARAWRMILDVKGAGMLQLSDFGMGCRQAGWRHPHVPLWKQLRDEGNGLVTMRALDPTTASAVDAFNDAVAAKYADVYAFWSEIVDPGGTGAINLTEFVTDVAKELGLDASSASRVFKCLDTQNTGGRCPLHPCGAAAFGALRFVETPICAHEAGSQSPRWDSSLSARPSGHPLARSSMGWT